MFPNLVNMILSTGESLIADEERYFINVLQLTPEQVDQIKMIELEYSDQIRQFAQEIQQADVDMNRLMVGIEPPDQIRREERALEALKIQAAPVYFEKFLAIREVLTLAQLQRIRSDLT